MASILTLFLCILIDTNFLMTLGYVVVYTVGMAAYYVYI